MKKLIGSLIAMTIISAAYMAGCSSPTPTAPGATATPTPAITATATKTPTHTPVNTATNSPTKTSTTTPMNTPTNTPTRTPTNSPTDSPTSTPTGTPTDTPSATPTSTPAGLSGPATVNFGNAAPFVVFSYNSITNVPATSLCGSMGEFAGTSVTGAPVVSCGGTTEVMTTASTNANTDLTSAYNDAVGRTAGAVNAELGSLTLVPGVYTAASFDIASGTNLTLDGTGYTNGGVFILQTAGILTTAASTQVILAGGAQAKNVIWQIGGAYATLGATSIFMGSIMCPGYVSAGHLTVLTGRLMSLTSYVALDSNTITLP